MITEFFINLWGNLALWFLGLFGDYEPIPAAVSDAIEGVASFFASSGAFLGALNHWFPAVQFVAIAAISVSVEVAFAMIRGVRKVKQLLPFQ